jgi:hypothetical protein
VRTWALGAWFGRSIAEGKGTKEVFAMSRGRSAWSWFGFEWKGEVYGR